MKLIFALFQTAVLISSTVDSLYIPTGSKLASSQHSFNDSPAASQHKRALVPVSYNIHLKQDLESLRKSRHILWTQLNQKYALVHNVQETNTVPGRPAATQLVSTDKVQNKQVANSTNTDANCPQDNQQVTYIYTGLYSQKDIEEISADPEVVCVVPN